MNRLKIGVTALLVVIGIGGIKAAVTSGEKHRAISAQEYFWYTPGGTVTQGFGTLPSSGCSASGNNCAKGFISQPEDPTLDQPDLTVAHN